MANIISFNQRKCGFFC